MVGNFTNQMPSAFLPANSSSTIQTCLFSSLTLTTPAQSVPCPNTSLMWGDPTGHIHVTCGDSHYHPSSAMGDSALYPTPVEVGPLSRVLFVLLTKFLLDWSVGHSSRTYHPDHYHQFASKVVGCEAPRAPLQ